MIPRLRRRLAQMACRILQGTLPRQLGPWGQAVEAEVAGIVDDGKALRFALGSLSGLMPRALAFHLVRASDALTGSNTLPGGKSAMSVLDAAREPRLIGIACAIGAVALGLAYMAAAGAPRSYLGINAAALLIGLLTIGILKMVGAGRVWNARYGPGLLTMVLAAALLATALLGVQADGAARWVSLGGLSIQPSLILLPVMMLMFARSRDGLSGAGMVLAAAALALQPDRAMAGLLAAGLAALAAMRPDRTAVTALAAAAIGFAVSLVRSDLLPASPYVDQVLFSSFEVHVLAGLAVLAGSALLVLPAIVGIRHDLAHGHVHLVFGAVWASAIAAAALGNYPTPLVGFGGSAILGYVLSLMALPGLARSRSAGALPNRGSNGRPPGPRLRAVLAQPA